MRTRRDDDYEIDTTAGRLDLDLVTRWLSTDAYWAVGRPADAIARSVANSVCFGVYDPAGGQVGFARVITDTATFAWLCDVYIAREARGLGLGTWLAQTTVAHLHELGVPRLILATLDAHGVYEKAGFVPLADPGRWMEIDLRRRAATA
jgi:GNAT superfamily N-acetyltransferase